MALSGLPDNVTEVGAVNISIYMGEEGVSFAYGYDGVAREAAIGYLQCVMDRLRDEARMDWGDYEDGGICLGPECPECGFTLDDPDDEDPDPA